MRTRHWSPMAQVGGYAYGADVTWIHTHLARFLASTGAATLRKKYQDIAKDVSKSFGCANCRGIEALRSALEAYEVLASYDANTNPSQIGGGDLILRQNFLTRYGPRLLELRGILADLNVPIDGKFGQVYDIAAYRHGLRGDEGKINPLEEPWYGDLKSLFVKKNGPGPFNAILGDGVGQSVTKPSAHAHAVVARASLAVGIRFGFCEFASFVSATNTKQVRPLRSIAQQALTLVDPNARVEQPLATAINTLKQRYGGVVGNARWERLTEAALAGELLDALTAGIAAIVAAGGPGARANCFALCTVLRGLLLVFSYRRARLARASWKSLRESALGSLPDLFTYNPRELFGNTSAFMNLRGFKDRMNRKDTGKFSKLVEEKGRTWATVREVEFGKQCGVCESKQGAFDLPGRVVDSRVEHGEATLDPKIGLTFSQMPIEASSGETPWDLTAATVCEAVGLVCKDLHAEAKGDKDVAAILAVFDASAPLFVAYMEALFLGLGFSGCTDMPLVLEMAQPRAPEERQVAILNTVARTNSEPRFAGPNAGELAEAAALLGLTLQDLLDPATGLELIKRRYRERAKVVAPRMVNDNGDALSALNGARDLLVKYLSRATQVESRRLALTQ